MKNIFDKKAFTLVELILYVSLIAILLLAISIFFTMLLGSRVKNQTIAEVEQAGVQVMQLITQTIRNTQNINSPAQGLSASSLSLDVVDAAKDPTVFDLSGGVIRITEGSGSPVELTASRVTASNLVFYNLSRAGTQGTMHVEFKLSHRNPDQRNEFEYNKTFYGSASLRQ